MTFSFTKVWAGSEVITADDLNGNFSDVASIINGGIKNQHLSTAANIAASKIADRYHIVKTTINLVPFSAGIETVSAREMFSDDAGEAPAGVTVEEFHVPLAPTTIFRHEIIANSGQEGHLMAISVYVTSVSDAGGDYPQLGAYLNSTLIGQNIKLKDDDGFYRLHANDPFSNPLLALADKDILDFKLDSDGSGVPTIRGVYATLYERWSIGS